MPPTGSPIFWHVVAGVNPRLRWPCAARVPHKISTCGRVRVRVRRIYCVTRYILRIYNARTLGEGSPERLRSHTENSSVRARTLHRALHTHNKEDVRPSLYTFVCVCVCMLYASPLCAACEYSLKPVRRCLRVCTAQMTSINLALTKNRRVSSS